MIAKILISNRGEIATRVIRSAKEMGIRTVAIYSDADRNAPHVRLADEAVHLIGNTSADTYLDGARIIQAAKDLGVDAIHPGYGFLSENADFARKVVNAGIRFIGPSAESIEMMGNKLSAKKAVSAFNIPLVPGTDKPIDSIEEAFDLADQIGFPVLLKAAAGGGGKGMRVVDHKDELKEQLQRAMSEALSAFGDSAVFIEKYVTEPRHIEIQVLADQHGNIIHLYERECSIQRRHQKVIEEAPSSVLTPEIRAMMGESAVNVAKACEYTGAGTVEFLVDSDLNYYFLEMNTRLQVEHPVTELITGLDLVKEQIKIANGSSLDISQEALKINGHAIELRVYAEDASNNFLPDTGMLTVYQPSKGPGVRVDDGYEEGMEVPIYYDPLLAKLVTHGKDRDEAIVRMVRAIEEYLIVGVNTTLGFGKWVMQQEAFKAGDLTTNFIADHFSPESFNKEDPGEAVVAAIFAASLLEQHKNRSLIKNGAANGISRSKWKNRFKGEMD